MTLSELNETDRKHFVDAIGFAFEHSPWVAYGAWEERPFASLDALLACLATRLAEAPEERRVGVLAAHPDLAGRVAREGTLTPASQHEQRAAGLDCMTPQEIARFDALNAAYRTGFGFPFVICAREHDKDSILRELERRTRNDRPAEIVAALGEVRKIARLRLADTIQEEVP